MMECLKEFIMNPITCTLTTFLGASLFLAGNKALSVLILGKKVSPCNISVSALTV